MKRKADGNEEADPTKRFKPKTLECPFNWVANRFLKNPQINPRMICDECPTILQTIAKKSCKSCGNFCDECDSKIHSHRSLSSHTRIPIAIGEIPRLQCIEHNKSKTIYCKEEKAVFCSVCIYESHKDHSTCSLEEYTLAVRKELEDCAVLDRSYFEKRIERLKIENEALEEIVQKQKLEIQQDEEVFKKAKVDGLSLSKSIEDLRDEVLVSQRNVDEIKKVIKEIEKESLDDRLGEYLYWKAMNLFIQSKYYQAAPLFIESAKAGFPAAKLKLAICSGEMGVNSLINTRGDFASDGVIEELRSSYDWFEKRAQSEHEAAHYYQTAANQGFALAQLHLGRCYENGFGRARNRDEAYNYYFSAEEQKFVAAYIQLGNFYEKDDYNTSFEYYVKAIENGYYEGVLALEKLVRKREDSQEILSYLEAALKHGVLGTYLRIGKMYLKGSHVDKNLTVGVRWLEMGFEEGDIRACAKLRRAYADMVESYLKGRNGLQANSKLAFKYLQSAIDFGYHETEAQSQFLVTSGYVKGSRLFCRKLRDCCIPLLLAKHDSSLLPEVWDVVVLSMLRHQIKNIPVSYDLREQQKHWSSVLY